MVSIRELELNHGFRLQEHNARRHSVSPRTESGVDLRNHRAS